MSARSWLPLASMSTLIVALGAYAAIRQDAFLTRYNLGNLLLATMPLALVALGQTVALLVRGFDVSVAALMTMCVVTASYTMKPGDRVEVRESRRGREAFKVIRETLRSHTAPEWLSLDAAKLAGTVTTLPRRDQMPPDLSEQLVVEYYSR